MNPITLRDGKTVEIAAFHCQAICTYISEAGVLEGSPKSLNRFRERERAGGYMEPPRATVLMLRWLDPNLMLVRSNLLHAWLRCAEQPAEVTDLVIAFFREMVDQPVETIVPRGRLPTGLGIN